MNTTISKKTVVFGFARVIGDIVVATPAAIPPNR